MTLSEQMSLRLTVLQREFIRGELAEMQSADPRAAKLCEADIVRAFIEEARLRRLTTTVQSAEAGT